MLAFGHTKGQLNEIDTIWSNPIEFSPGRIGGFSMNADETQVLVILGEHITFYNTVNGEFIQSIHTEIGSYASDFDISMDWEYIAARDGGSTTRIIDVQTGKTLLYVQSTSDCAISDDGEFALISEWRGEKDNLQSWIVKFDLSSMEEINSVNIGLKSPGNINMEISNDGRYFCYESYIEEFDVQTGKNKYIFRYYLADTETLGIVDTLVERVTDHLHYEIVSQSYFLKNRNVLLFNAFGKVYEYNIDSNALNLTELHSMSFNGFSTDEKYICTVLRDDLFHVFSLNTAEEIYIANFYGISCAPTLDNGHLICLSGGIGAITKIRAPWTMVGTDGELDDNSNIYYENGVIHISFSNLISQNLNIELYDLEGNLVQKLNEDYHEAGEQKFQFPVTLSSGSYFITIKSNSGFSAKKLLVVN